MALTPEQREKLQAERKEKIKQRLEDQSRGFDNEVRVCRACGWRTTKHEAIRNGYDRCQRCGGRECVGLSMDFVLTPDRVRQQMKQQQNQGGKT